MNDRDGWKDVVKGHCNHHDLIMMMIHIFDYDDIFMYVTVYMCGYPVFVRVFGCMFLSVVIFQSRTLFLLLCFSLSLCLCLCLSVSLSLYVQ